MKTRIIILGLIGLFPGCAGMIKKSDLARDLGAIIAKEDCPAACAALKIYIRDRLAQ